MTRFSNIDDGGKNRQQRKKGKDIRDRRREDVDKYESVARRQNKLERHNIAEDPYRRARKYDYKNYDLDEFAEDI
jgi:hypothetical protein